MFLLGRLNRSPASLRADPRRCCRRCAVTPVTGRRRSPERALRVQSCAVSRTRRLSAIKPGRVSGAAPRHQPKRVGGLGPYRSAEQTALMRTQIPSCCIDLQNHCIKGGWGDQWRPDSLPPLGWGAGDLNEECGGGVLISILYSVPIITSVFSTHLSWRFPLEGHPPVSQ